jgi:uncharacterized protein (TIGR02996 family)
VSAQEDLDAPVQAIRADPTDDDRWGVLGDWLEERGDGRAQRVRLAHRVRQAAAAFPASRRAARLDLEPAAEQAHRDSVPDRNNDHVASVREAAREAVATFARTLLPPQRKRDTKSAVFAGALRWLAVAAGWAGRGMTPRSGPDPLVRWMISLANAVGRLTPRQQARL